MKLRVYIYQPKVCLSLAFCLLVSNVGRRFELSIFSFHFCFKKFDCEFFKAILKESNLLFVSNSRLVDSHLKSGFLFIEIACIYLTL